MFSINKSITILAASLAMADALSLEATKECDRWPPSWWRRNGLNICTWEDLKKRDGKKCWRYFPADDSWFIGWIERQYSWGETYVDYASEDETFTEDGCTGKNARWQENDPSSDSLLEPQPLPEPQPYDKLTCQALTSIDPVTITVKSDITDEKACIKAFQDGGEYNLSKLEDGTFRLTKGFMEYWEISDRVPEG